MAGGFPVGLQLNAMGGSSPSATAGGVAVVSNASNNVLGSYVELVSSTARASTWAMVTIQDSVTSTSGTTSAVNIATGASGSESVLLNNLVIQRDSLSSEVGDSAVYFLPLVIPAGTRIAANCQSTGISVTLLVSIALFDDAFGSVVGGGAVDTYGFTSASTLGVQIDPGGTAVTKGAYSEITSSLTYGIAGFIVAFDGQGVSGSATARWTFDVAVGASGSEVIVLPDFQIYGRGIATGASKPIYPPCTPFMPIQIPAGTRVAIRAQCNSNSSVLRVFGTTFYGVRL